MVVQDSDDRNFALLVHDDKPKASLDVLQVHTTVFPRLTCEQGAAYSVLLDDSILQYLDPLHDHRSTLYRLCHEAIPTDDSKVRP